MELYSLRIKENTMKEKDEDRNLKSMRTPKISTGYDFESIALVSSWESDQNQTFGRERLLAAATASPSAASASASSGDLTWVRS